MKMAYLSYLVIELYNSIKKIDIFLLYCLDKVEIFMKTILTKWHFKIENYSECHPFFFKNS